MKTSTPIPILNRGASEPPADGWYQIEVTGEHPASDERVQVIDAAALQSIVNRFNQEKTAAGENWGGMLVDADHLSHDLENPTEALAWAQELAIRDGQLHARLDLTDLGDGAIRNKRYKFFSTEYHPASGGLEDLGGGRVRPLRLSGLAFTNRPNNRGAKPISNRAEDSPGETTKTTTMKSIANKLGLPDDASEADILAKIGTLQDEHSSMRGKQAESEASAVMNRFGARVPDAAKELWKGKLIANRAAAEAEMEVTFPAVAKPPGGRAPIHNREGTKAPDPVEGDSTTDRSVEQRQVVEEIQIHNRCSWSQAWNIAKGKRPELFAN